MTGSGLIDGGRKIRPIEATAREMIVEVGEGGPWFGADRNSHSDRHAIWQLGGGQDRADRFIPAKRSQELRVLEKYKQVLAPIRNKSEALKISITLNSD